MVTYNTHRKKGFRCLFAGNCHYFGCILRCFRCWSCFPKLWDLQLRLARATFLFTPFHRFGFFGGDGLDDQEVIIQQPQSAPTTEPSEPTENRIYIPPRWVDGGYGVQVSTPGYWAVPQQAAEH
jgi:hypothetical protein